MNDLLQDISDVVIHSQFKKTGYNPIVKRYSSFITLEKLGLDRNIHHQAYENRKQLQITKSLLTNKMDDLRSQGRIEEINLDSKKRELVHYASTKFSATTDSP